MCRLWAMIGTLPNLYMDETSQLGGLQAAQFLWM